MSKQRKSREAFTDEHTHSHSKFDSDDYNTSSGNLSSLLELIGTGEQNAIHQGELVRITGMPSREITMQIEQLRRSGAVILSSHNGYFKPETMLELTEYINRERSRARNILKTLRTAEEYRRKAENL